MKIIWSNGYREGYPSSTAVEVARRPGQCNRCLFNGDQDEKPVIRFDNSDGEYNPIQLCALCLGALLIEYDERVKS